MSRKVNTEMHEFYCTQCGGSGIPVRRKYNHFRELGHLKKLYCLSCGKETNHVECVNYSKYDVNTFYEEYQSGNFDESGKRILPFSDWKHKKKIEEAINDMPDDDQEVFDLEEWYEMFGIEVCVNDA